MEILRTGNLEWTVGPEQVGGQWAIMVFQGAAYVNVCEEIDVPINVLFLVRDTIEELYEHLNYEEDDFNQGFFGRSMAPLMFARDAILSFIQMFDETYKDAIQFFRTVFLSVDGEGKRMSAYKYLFRYGFKENEDCGDYRYYLIGEEGC